MSAALGRAHRPISRSGAALPLLALLGLTAIRLAVAAAAPLAPDETYYRIWAFALAPGYLDHPPMVALWIRAGIALAGDDALGVRLLGPLAALAGTLLLADAARALAGPRAAAPALWLMNGTLLMNAGAVIMTPDTPLLFFWTAALWTAARLAAGGSARWLLGFGLAAGLALDSKYTAALLAPALLVWLALPPQRRLWRAWPLWAGGALALLLFAPVLIWNGQHHWVSFIKQGGREGVFRPGLAARYLTELALGQIGLATPVIFAALGLGLRRLVPRYREPGAALVLAFTLVPAAVFIAHATGDRVQANWPAPVYPAAVLAAAIAQIGFWRAAALSGLLLTAPVYAQAALAPLPLPRRIDFTLARLGGWDGLAAAIDAAARAEGAHFLAADEYGVAAELAFHSRLPVAGVEPRWTLFRLPPATADAGPGLFVRSEHHRAPIPWRDARRIATLTRARHGIAAETYALYLVHGAPDRASVWLPGRFRR